MDISQKVEKQLKKLMGLLRQSEDLTLPGRSTSTKVPSLLAFLVQKYIKSRSSTQRHDPKHFQVLSVLLRSLALPFTSTKVQTLDT